jgi:hypothetical protein
MTSYIKKRKSYTYQLHPEIVDAAKAYAIEHDVSMSRLVETALTQHITVFKVGGGQQ